MVMTLEQQAAYRERNREKLRAYKKRWDKENLERARYRRSTETPEKRAATSAYQREYRRKNPERLRAAGRKYQAKRYAEKRSTLEHGIATARERETRRQWQFSNWNRVMWSRTKARARKRGLEFTIAPTDIVVPDSCPIFGVPLEIGSRLNSNSPSVDRIDSTVGYVPGNVWVISHRANAIKNSGTPEEHEKIAMAVRFRLNANCTGRRMPLDQGD